MTEKKFPDLLVGCRVVIEWRDADCEWRNYAVLRSSGGWLLLDGRANRDGVPNDTMFWAPLADMATIVQDGLDRD